jgi:hypothetical protein
MKVTVMNPPIENNIQNDVAFYLHECEFEFAFVHECEQPLLAINFRDALLKELNESYGEESVELEIKKQKELNHGMLMVNI